ncbi:DUF2164 domain-containing protein [Priestia abyssalis]|uniref:DUF2164 domain-containing protein n=1 Tax=Priestia abyssalis TaxID=1221450 RepID=UPI000995CB1A|nr:DUF2164 domain-containing protein [Priestia abyssalis]
MFIKFSQEQKNRMIADIQRFFEEERGEEIGELAAESVLEFVKEHLGPHFYNQAIKDTKELIEQKMLSIEEDLYALERPIKG